MPAVTQVPAAAPPFIAEPAVRYDPAVQLAAAQTDVPVKPDSAPASVPAKDSTDGVRDIFARRLAPHSSESASDKVDAESTSKSSALPFAFSNLESFSTAGAGLAIVIGLFLVSMWMLRRGGAKQSGVLPSDAFVVLGRAPLTPQSFAHLIRLGNKLVLVAMSADGIQPLTEVTDPMEVDRLTGLCASDRGHGPSAEFQQVLAHLSREPATGFLGAEAAASGRRYAA
jgi:flagellar biogenesis protein FliO